MKVLLVNGSPNKEGSTYIALKQNPKNTKRRDTITKTNKIKLKENILNGKNRFR